MDIEINIHKTIYSYCFVSMSDVNSVALYVLRQSDCNPIDNLTLDFSEIELGYADYVNDIIKRIYSIMSKHEKYKGKELPKIKEFKLIGITSNNFSKPVSDAKVINDESYNAEIEYRKYEEKFEAERKARLENGKNKESQ